MTSCNEIEKQERHISLDDADATFYDLLISHKELNRVKEAAKNRVRFCKLPPRWGQRVVATQAALLILERDCLTLRDRLDAVMNDRRKQKTAK